MGFTEKLIGLLSAVKIWEDKICKALPVKTIIVICVISIFNHLGAIQFKMSTISSQMSSIKSDISAMRSDVSSEESEAVSINAR